MNRRAIVTLAVAASLVAVGILVLMFLWADGDAVEVSLEPGGGDMSRVTTDTATLRIAVAAMTSPKETFEYYEDMLGYIGRKMNRPVELVQRESYQEVNDLVEQGQLDLAFVCTGAYVEGHGDFGMELLVAPVVYGDPLYYSYVIVPVDSAARSLEDLRGTRFAFTDPLSNTGTLAPIYMVGQIGETPASFFGETIYTYSHDRSIAAVADGVVDAAAVDSLIYDFMKASGDPAIGRTRVLIESPPYGIPPVVVPPALDPELKAEFRDVFLGMHLDEEGAAILADIRIDRFATIEDSAYDSVREMQAWLDENEVEVPQ